MELNGGGVPKISFWKRKSRVVIKGRHALAKQEFLEVAMIEGENIKGENRERIGPLKECMEAQQINTSLDLAWRKCWR